MDKTTKQKLKLFFTFLSFILLTACTNSEFFLSAIYNQADNLLYRQVSGYADFDSEQKAEIRDLINHFHHWHRTTQLPRYAEFLRTVERDFSSAPINEEQIWQWYEWIEALVDDSGRCHPMLYGIDIMISLSDEQLIQIREHMTKQYEEIYEYYEESSEEERLEDSYKSIRKWLGRFELDLDKTGKNLLRQTLADLPDLRAANYELWKQWDMEFHHLLEDRDVPDFKMQMRQHIFALRTLTESQYPQEYATSQALWANFFLQILSSEQIDEKQDFSSWALKMATNLDAISLNVPREQRDWDARQYCADIN